MPEVRLGDRRIPVQGSAVAMLYFRQEFGCDMSDVLARVLMGFLRAFPSVAGRSIQDLSGLELDPAEITPESLASAELDALGTLQLVWAMAKAAVYPRRWPSFEPWVASLGDANITDVEFITAALGVAADGLFRRPAEEPVGR